MTTTSVTEEFDGGDQDDKPVSSVLPKRNCEYNSRDYWDERFSKESDYEWLLAYSDLAPQLSNYLTKDSRILVVGCGNAPFSVDLYDDGFHNVVNIDYSTQVIAKMQGKHSLARPGMQWLVMDMTKLSFDDDSFDVVIDKAALDALLSDEGDVWNPNQESIQAADQVCRSISRVLKSGGAFLQISLVQPHFRKKYLLGWYCEENVDCSDNSYSDAYHWSFQVHVAGDTGSSQNFFGHYLYVMTKREQSPKLSVEVGRYE
jgi:SAM-dependent methyltransferase